MSEFGNERSILDNINAVGIGVVDKDARSVLYFNRAMQEYFPDITLGMAWEAVPGIETLCCPLDDILEKRMEKFVTYSHRYENVIDIAANSMMWEGKTPAYIISFSPHVSSTAEQTMLLERQHMNLALADVYVIVISVNLTQNSYSFIERGTFYAGYTPFGCYDRLAMESAKMVHADDKEAFSRVCDREDLLARYASGERNCRVEYRVTLPGGAKHWISLQVILLEEKHMGDVVGVTFARIIDDEKQSELRLENLLREKTREMDKFYHTLTNGIAKVSHNRERTLLFGNEHYFEMIGYTPEEFRDLCGNSLVAVIDPRDRNQIRSDVVVGETISHRYRIRRKDGSVRWVRIEGSLTDEIHNGVNVFYVFLSDITVPVLNEQETIRKQQMSALVVSSLAGGAYISTADEERRLIYTSESLCHLLGYSQKALEEIMQGTAAGLVLPKDRTRVAQEYVWQMQSMDYFELEYRMRKSDGSIIWVLEKGRRVQVEGETMHVSVLMDITERKMEELRLMNKTRIDSLTGLHNENYTHSAIQVYLENRIPNQAVALFIVDLRHLRRVNEQYSRIEGDMAIVAMGAFMARYVSERTILGRVGGSKFYMLFRDEESFASLETVADEITQYVATSLKRKYPESGIAVDVGVAYVEEEAVDSQRLIGVAEAALESAHASAQENTWRIMTPAQADAYVETVGQSNKDEVSADDKYVNELTRQNILLRQMHMEDERYRVITEQSDMAIFEWNLMADRFYASPSIYEYEGGSIWKDMVMDQPVKYDWLHQDDIPAFSIFLQKLGQGEKEVSATVRLLRTDGAYVWSKIAVNVLRFEDGRPLRAIGTVTNNDDLVKTMEKLEYRAAHDPLTGYSTFEKFRTDVVEILKHRGDQRYAISYMDINNFKVINDVYGYQVGDNLLRYWAEYVAEMVQPMGTFARISADHFIILQIMRDEEEYTSGFEEACRYLEQFEVEDGKPIRVGMTVGAYWINADEDILTVDEMMDRAIIAQKTVKDRGGCQYAFYSENMRNRILHEKDVENCMYSAVSGREFQVYFQPVVDIQQDENVVVGAEALVRWSRPGVGMVTPDVFIPIFEKNGFIVKLDHYIFDEVCRYLSAKMQAGEQYLRRVSVNVSRITMMQPDFVERYMGICNKYGVPYSLIVLESTESTFVESYQPLSDAISTMRRLGFRCAMDDFGTGYSSLTMLKSIPIDVLKLDMMFIRGSTKNGRDRAIIRCVVEMAADLEIQAIAEGVETAEHVEYLRGIGCPLVQGYYFSKPVPLDAFDETVREIQSRAISAEV